MHSSISSSSPSHVRPNAPAWRRFVVRSLAFVAILFCLDRLIGKAAERGLDRYFGMDRDAAVLLVGHSKTILGLDDAALEHELAIPVAKYAMNGANIFDREIMVRHFFSQHPGQVKLVVYDVDGFTLNQGNLSANSYRLFYPYMDDPQVASYVRANDPSVADYYIRKLLPSTRYDETSLWLSLRGHFGFGENLKRGTVDLARLRARMARGQQQRPAIQLHSLAAFDRTISYIRSTGARVLLIYLPVVDVLNDADREGEARTIGIYEQYASRDAGVLFWNYSKQYESKHELFMDGIHLNQAGQSGVTSRLSAELAALMKQPAQGTKVR
jgi:hypothetical protein